MAKYSVYGVINATKYIGEFEANSEEEAEEMAWDSETGFISICYHCSKEIEEPTIYEMVVEEV